MNQVKITKNNKPRCPVHGEQDAEYKAQKAPCGLVSKSCPWATPAHRGNFHRFTLFHP